MKPLENDLKKLVLEYLERQRFIVIRVNSGKIKKGQRMIKLAKKGTSDIIAAMPPKARLLAVETKREGEVATKDQLDFQADVRRVGGIAVIAYCLEDVVKAVNAA